MISLVLAIVSSSSIALLLKNNDIRGGEPLTLLAGNYLMATLLGVGFLVSQAERTFSWETLFLGAALALGFVAIFLVFAKAVGVAGTALATVSSRLSMVIPVALSVILFGEVPTGYQYAGFALAFVTLGFFYLSTRSHSQRHGSAAYLYLVVLFLGIGVNDFALKLFQETRPASDKPFFLVSIFAFSLLYTMIVILWRGITMDRATVRRGLVLGVPNILSSFFLLSALAQMEAVFVYPAVNIGVILTTTVAAAILWHERLDRWGVAALGAGVAAIVAMAFGS